VSSVVLSSRPTLRVYILAAVLVVREDGGGWGNWVEHRLCEGTVHFYHWLLTECCQRKEIAIVCFLQLWFVCCWERTPSAQTGVGIVKPMQDYNYLPPTFLSIDGHILGIATLVFHRDTVGRKRATGLTTQRPRFGGRDTASLCCAQQEKLWTCFDESTQKRMAAGSFGA